MDQTSSIRVLAFWQEKTNFARSANFSGCTLLFIYNNIGGRRRGQTII